MNFCFLFNLILGMFILNIQGQNQTLTDGMNNDNITSLDIKITIATSNTPLFDKWIPSLNVTSILFSSLALIGLLGVLVTVYICYVNSCRHIEFEQTKSGDQDNIPLYTISSF